MEEGYAMNKPPMFKGANYDYLKERMIAFFKSTHIDMWDIVEKGYHIPLNTQRNETPKDRWMDECNDPPRCYDITTLKPREIQFLNENSINLVMKN